MTTCIYCLESKPVSSFQRAEHVIPQAFGKFEGDAVLHQVVCDECNQWFGDNLEIHLARDTIEGRLRFSHGLKPASEFKHMGSESRLILKALEGDVKGAHLELFPMPDGSGLGTQALPQIGLRRKDGEMDWFLLDDFPESNTINEDDYELKGPECMLVLRMSNEETGEFLKSRGWTFIPKRPLEHDPERTHMPCVHLGTIDETVERAIAKIAFNYLAWTHGREYLLDPSFDALRRFVRYGEPPDYKVVMATDDAFLLDEAGQEMRRLGHFVTVNLAADGQSTVAQVSLFNFIKYSVCLARQRHATTSLRPTGHFLHVGRREIMPLGRFSQLELIPFDTNRNLPHYVDLIWARRS